MNIHIRLVLLLCCNAYGCFELLCVCDLFFVIYHVLNSFV